MSARQLVWGGFLVLLLGALGIAPQLGNDYTTSLLINLLLYANLATAWGLFCGSTRYISLATVAFFGVGAYTVAVLGEKMPWVWVLGVAVLVGAILALLVGLVTLRLSGTYFVIFTFGMTELLRQIVNWYENKVAGAVGRYVFIDGSSQHFIFYQLMFIFVLVIGLGAWLSRSRLGFELRLVGADEAAAKHCGIDTVRVKLSAFVLTSICMVLTGAVVAPRWTYIDPAIAFNSIVSFQVVIMALLGGASRFWGPLVGVIPLVLLFEILQKYFPNHFLIVLGIVFLVIVYALPRGVVGFVDKWRLRWRKSPKPVLQAPHAGGQA